MRRVRRIVAIGSIIVFCVSGNARALVSTDLGGSAIVRTVVGSDGDFSLTVAPLPTGVSVYVPDYGFIQAISVAQVTFLSGKGVSFPIYITGECSGEHDSVAEYDLAGVEAYWGTHWYLRFLFSPETAGNGPGHVVIQADSENFALDGCGNWMPTGGRYDDGLVVYGGFVPPQRWL
jgi:hypothetical protein